MTIEEKAKKWVEKEYTDKSYTPDCHYTVEREAKEYADKHAFRVPYDGSNKFYDDVDFKTSKEGYLAGALPREKRIEELEQQIEKMKKYLDCEYCEHYTQPYGCKNCNEEIRSDWKLKEIKEND